jgi:hypothetical protein
MTVEVLSYTWRYLLSNDVTSSSGLQSPLAVVLKSLCVAHWNVASSCFPRPSDTPLASDVVFTKFL